MMKKLFLIILSVISLIIIFSCTDDISKSNQIIENVRIEYSKCTGCNECITDFSCPENAIKIDTLTNTNYIDMTKCIGCMKCVDAFNCRFDAFTTQKDIIKPSVISNLTSNAVTDTSITFIWSAPADDENDSLGKAYKYIVKFSTDSIIDANWNEYQSYPITFNPTEFSYEENLTIKNLTPETRYFIAIKSVDESDNLSEISNIYSKTTLQTVDNTIPSTIENLESSAFIDRLTLSWTAPGDDDNIGTVTKYIIKTSTDSITNDNWEEIAEYPNSIIPKESGNSENFTITNLISQTKYFIGIKSIDNAGNISQLSNITSNKIIGDVVAPAMISDLSSSVDVGIISLNWTAPGDDENIGTATKYTIKISTDSITNDNWEEIAEHPNSIIPKEAGSLENFNIEGLSVQTEYFIAIKSVDDAGNISQISNITSASLLSDIIPPSAISDLSSTATETVISLNWTAPGDDENTGTVTQYVIKISTDIITNDNWEEIAEHPNSIIPKEAGSSENFNIEGLSVQTEYFVGIKSVDDAGNISQLSNITSATLISDTTPPSAISDLSITEGTASSLTQMELTWTAPGDDENTGSATSYEIKYSLNPITATNFNSATTVANSITPAQAGSSESFVVSGITAAEIYYFAIKSVDDAGNISLISNNTAGKTVYQVLPSRCNGCGRCVNHCPENAISIPGYDAVIDADKCTACGTCVNWCPRNAIIKTVVKYQ